MMTIEVIEPAGQVHKLAPLQLSAMPSIEGRRLAILGNRKPNFDRLATLVAGKLYDDFALKSIEHFSKENAAVGATSELLDRIAQSADLVLTGAAD